MIALSASRIKTLNHCSFTYWCQYVLKLPRFSNDGSRRGTTTHLVFECLQNPRHRRHYDAVAESGLAGSKAVERLVRRSMKREGCEGEENYQMINDFVFTGLNFDFFMEGYVLENPEFKFDIEDAEKHYRVLGYIDLLGISEDGTIAKIRDYKSSKQKPSGEEKHFSVQGLMYQLAVSKLFPKIKKSFVEFIYLKFKKKPKEVFSVGNNALKGFEDYLTHIQEYVESFDFKKATSNFAANDFLKKNLCGTREDRFKEDGSPKWRCPYLLPFEYFVLIKDGKDVKSAMTEEELKAEEGQSVEKRSYGGCCHFFKENYKK